MLTTTGRRTGRARTTPLTYFQSGEEIAIVASNGGEDSPPRWWLNLQAEPRATIAIEGRSEQVTAREATADEHARLWPAITGTFAAYGDYARRTSRPIPVVILSGTKENAPNR
jgi:deazaflavin-dependent oxidoreductase (nitroreductase family)